jgi:hypothetical protein
MQLQVMTSPAAHGSNCRGVPPAATTSAPGVDIITERSADVDHQLHQTTSNYINTYHMACKLTQPFKITVGVGNVQGWLPCVPAKA